MAIQTDTLNVPTIIEFILDETGSMQSCLSGAIAGFNQFLKEQAEIDSECYFTLTKFSTNQKLTVYSGLDIKMVPSLNKNTFIPNGGTNLCDTIMERIKILKATLSEWDITPKVLFVCLTDGEDNSSRWSEHQIKKEIELTDEWSFVYLGANQNAAAVALNLGFPKNNIKTFETEKFEETMTELSSRTAAYRSGTVQAKAFYSNGEQQ
jgi:hypothetical protein